MFEYVANAYIILVKAGKYILDESQRTDETQKVVPSEYAVVIAEKIVSNI